MTVTLPLLFISAMLVLSGFVVSGLALRAARRTEALQRRRFNDILEPHAPLKPAQGPAHIVLVRDDRQNLTFGGRVASLFGVVPFAARAVPVPVWSLVLACLVAAVPLTWLAAALLGQAVWFALIALWPILSRMILGWFTHRRARTLFRQFPDALSMIVRGVRVGIPVGDSVRAVAIESPHPTAQEFRVLADELTIGISLEDALRNLAQRNQLQEYRFFATAMALQSQTGGRLSETLENLADTIRKRVMVRARGHALAAETRTSSSVLAVLPFIAFAGLLLISPDYAVLLFTDPLGHIVLASAILSLGTGLFMMRTMINRALS